MFFCSQIYIFSPNISWLFSCMRYFHLNFISVLVNPSKSFNWEFGWSYGSSTYEMVNTQRICWRNIICHKLSMAESTWDNCLSESKMASPKTEWGFDISIGIWETIILEPTKYGHQLKTYQDFLISERGNSGALVAQQLLKQRWPVDGHPPHSFI